MATHSSVLAWRVPGTGEPGLWGRTESDTTEVTWQAVFSHVQLFATPWTVVHQAPLSMRLSRQESHSALPFPSPGYLLHPGIKGLLALQADSLPTEPPGKP